MLGVGVDLDLALVGVQQLQLLLQLHPQHLVLCLLGLIQPQLWGQTVMSPASVEHNLLPALVGQPFLKQQDMLQYRFLYLIHVQESLQLLLPEITLMSTPDFEQVLLMFPSLLKQKYKSMKNSLASLSNAVVKMADK